MLNIYNTINAQTVEDAMLQGGLAFEVDQTDVYTKYKGHEILIPSHKAVVRDDNSVVLSLMGKNYTPIKNSERAKWANELVSAGSAMFKSVGVIGAGEVSWMLAELPDDLDFGLQDDKLKRYLLFADSYDGSLKFTTKFTTIRPVCMNTFHKAIEQNANVQAQHQAFRHTPNVLEHIDDVRDALKLVDSYYANLGGQLAKLAQQDLTKDQAYGFFQEVLGIVDDGQEVSTRLYNKLGKMTDLYEGDALGAELAGQTAWGALNAVTEYVDHHSTVRGNDESKRLYSSWFGTGEQMKQRGFYLLMSSVEDAHVFAPRKIKVGKSEEMMEMAF